MRAGRCVAPRRLARDVLGGGVNDDHGTLLIGVPSCDASCAGPPAGGAGGTAGGASAGGGGGLGRCSLVASGHAANREGEVLAHQRTNPVGGENGWGV